MACAGTCFARRQASRWERRRPTEGARQAELPRDTIEREKGVVFTRPPLLVRQVRTLHSQGEQKMRIHTRRLVTRFVAPMATALGVFLIAGPSALGTGGDVYGVGGGSTSFGGPSKVITFDFSGHTGPQGDFGHFHFAIKEASAPLDAHVDLDCVNVFPFPSLGAGGWMGGVVTKVTPEPNVYGISPGDQLLFGINDFGE